MSETPRNRPETGVAFTFRSQGLPQPVPTPENALAALLAIRAEAESLVDKLVGFLDMTEPDPDLEPDLAGHQHGPAPDLEMEPEHDEDNHDGEPSLGSTNPIVGRGQDHGIWSAGGDDDREGDPLDQGELEHDGCEPCEDGEPSLGWTESGFVGQTSVTYNDGEAAGYVVAKADAVIRRRLKQPRKRNLSNVSIEPALTGRSRVRLPNGREIR